MIFVTKNNEGYWLNFRSANGEKQCSLHVENFLEKALSRRGGIIENSIRETCSEDCLFDYSKKEEN